MDYKRYDIVVIPPEGIARQAIEMSQELNRFDSFFVLDGKTLHPHISLYHIPLNEEAVEAVKKSLEKIATDTKPFSLTQDTYYPDQGVWIGVRYVADKAILDLHTSVIEATKGYRAQEDDTRYRSMWSELSPARRKNIEECGWSNAFTYYSPHISFAKLKQPNEGVLDHLPHHDFSFLAERVGLCELGKAGTCVNIVAAFNLRG